MSAATLIFLCIGVLGIAVAAVALLGGDLFGGDLLDLGEGIVSTEIVAATIGGFGFGAAAANELAGHLGIIVVLLLGAVIAALMAIGAWLTVHRVRNMHTDGTPTRADLVGTRGVVVSPIPVGGYGEVRIRIGGQPVKLNARADRALTLGTKVIVQSTLSETSVVVQETAPAV